jgi:adenylate cyclase
MKSKVFFIIFNLALFLLWLNFPQNQFTLRSDDIYYLFNKNNPNQDIIFLDIDEKSINKFGRWPWDRDILAKVFDNLKDAKMVVLDMVFSEPTKKDTFLADSISNLNSVCGFFLRTHATQTIKNDILEILLDSSVEMKGAFLSAKYAEANVYNIIQSCTLNGIFSTIPDKDELYRHYPLAMIYKNYQFPSIGLQALRLYFNQDAKIINHTLEIGDRKIPLEDNYFVKLNYYNLNKYNRVSIVDANKINFKNKIVIVGISEAGISDLRATPLGQIPGPLLHYTFISNVLNKDFIRQSKSINLVIFILFLFLPLFLSKFISNIKLRAIFYILIPPLFIFISILIYRTINFQIELFYPIFGLLSNMILIEGFMFYKKEKESKFIKEAFKSYLSGELLNEISKHPEKLKLGGEKREATILFTDIRNFTTLSENLDPKDVVTLINSIFTPLSHIITKHKGMVDKYIGDAIMAIYNAPVDVPDHPTLACKSAVLMQLELKKINKKLKEKGFNEIAMGIGINTDFVAVGNMGSDIKFNYSALGDGVNLASRLESSTKVVKEHILISKSTYDRIDKNYFICKSQGSIKVKGKAKEVEIYSLHGFGDYVIK